MVERMTPEEIRRDIEVLSVSGDVNEVADAAERLAASEDADAIDFLGRVLATHEFLARLDDLSDPSLETQNLFRVFRALAEHPIEATGRVSEALFAVAEFRSIPARVNLLLGAVAAVRPTGGGAANIFRAAIREGYAEVVGPLLVTNASPLSLQVFEELIEKDWIESYVKVDIMHRSVLPKRTSLPVLTMCGRLLEAGLLAEVQIGIIETLFDYRSRQWFGPAMNPPTPPHWDLASTESLRFLVALGSRILAEQLAPSLDASLRLTLGQLEKLLQGRP
jgi:hypothetical protein